MEEAALSKSQLVMAAVEANMNYVREVLRPRIFEVMGKDAFMMEAMSTSFVSRAVMDRFNETMPEYRYRRVAINARNPKSEANTTEKHMIQFSPPILINRIGAALCRSTRSRCSCSSARCISALPVYTATAR